MKQSVSAGVGSKRKSGSGKRRNEGGGRGILLFQERFRVEYRRHGKDDTGRVSTRETGRYGVIGEQMACEALRHMPEIIPEV